MLLPTTRGMLAGSVAAGAPPPPPEAPPPEALGLLPLSATAPSSKSATAPTPTRTFSEVSMTLVSLPLVGDVCYRHAPARARAYAPPQHAGRAGRCHLYAGR